MIEIKQGEIRREEKRPQVALDLPPKSANGIKPAKINPLEIAKQNSARLELQKQQEQKNHQKALKSTQSSNRLSSSGSHNTESDANKDFAYQIVNNIERERRKMNLKRKTKDDYSLIEFSRTTYGFIFGALAEIVDNSRYFEIK